MVAITINVATRTNKNRQFLFLMTLSLIKTQLEKARKTDIFVLISFAFFIWTVHHPCLFPAPLLYSLLGQSPSGQYPTWVHLLQASDFTVPLPSSSHLSSPLSLSLGLLRASDQLICAKMLNHSWFKSIVLSFLKYLHTVHMKYIINSQL